MVVQMVMGAAVPTEAVVGQMVRTVVAVRSVNGAHPSGAEAGRVAAMAIEEGVPVVDTGGEVVRVVAIGEMTPRREVVAIAVGMADVGLVVVASCILLST